MDVLNWVTIQCQCHGKVGCSLFYGLLFGFLEHINLLANMNKVYASNPIALFFGGKWWDILCPWVLSLNYQNNILKVSKRNWFLIGTDEQIVPFRLIRRININTHFWGADVEISVFGSGKISAFCLSKTDAQEVKNILIDNNIKK